MIYLNPKTNQTAVCNSDKADKDGNVWVEIDGKMPVKMNYSQFIKEFHSMPNSDATKTIGAKAND